MRRRSMSQIERMMVVLGVLASCTAAHAVVHEVEQIGNIFDPETVYVAPGDTVKWVWTSGNHTVTSGANCTYDGMYFDALLDSGHPTFEFVVPANVDEIPYFCRPHCGFGMVGTIVVETVVAEFQITLDGYQEVPPVTTAATGSGTATLYSSDRLEWSIMFENLSSPQTAAHFHGPAEPCANAGVAIALPNGSPIQGSEVLSTQRMNDLMDGLWYVNVHTQMYPGGEIRGRVAPAPLANPIPGGIQQGDIHVRLEPVADGMTAPNWGTAAPGVAGRLFVTDQVGTVWNVNLGTGAKSVFLDVSSRLVPLGINGPGTFDERGLLGLAFHPDYQNNGKLYTYTSEPDTRVPDFSTMPMGTNPNHQAVITEWTVQNPSDPNAVADPNSARVLLVVDEPQFNHNAGALDFGPDGNLYIAFGDGGGRDDRDDGMSLGVPLVGHGCGGNGQNIDSVLGAILRIDVDGNNSGNGQYGVPASNPFVNQAGLDEIWAYGFRNPFRMSFDRVSGELYVGDVGQNHIEEVDIVEKGANYGWRYKEGSFYFIFNGNQPGYVTDHPVSTPAGLVEPVAEYDHDEGISVIGGFVYRGTDEPLLAGKYVFGEFGQTFNQDGRLFYLETVADATEIREFPLIGRSGVDLFVLGFGEDANGEVYVLTNETGVPFQQTGAVLRVASGRGDLNCDGLVDFGDINPFVQILSDPNGWQQTYPDCPMSNGDIDRDNVVGFGDINPFVGLLTAP